jgi:signal transduction histidine kinase
MLLRQSEKMAQLGTLMAGIAHELNNPAAAVTRGSKQLSTAFNDFQFASRAINTFHLPVDGLEDILQRIKQRTTHAIHLDGLVRGDRETDMEEWLADHRIEQAWKLAPHLVDQFESTAAMESFIAGYPPSSLPTLLEWIVTGYEVYMLIDEVGQGSGRISEIVKALKSYVYLDQAPVQEIDLHEGLENTLVILRHKLKQGIEVVREYAPFLPPILAYGSELNQVWTNIIDNAIDAMEGNGRLTIRTRFEDPLVTVMIEDSGPGIPENVQHKMFNPFYTTKPLGKGTGLGLNITHNIVQKHHGDIQVTSRPGQTRFIVRLPKNFEQTPQ